MRIEIHYVRRWTSELQVMALSPDEYFDPVEQGESYEEDGIPKHNHAEGYLGLPISQLIWTEIHVMGTSEDHIIRTEYSETGKATMIHRLDADGYEEMIHFTQLTRASCHIIRTWKRGSGGWSVCLNSLIEDMPDGSQREESFDINDIC